MPLSDSEGRRRRVMRWGLLACAMAAAAAAGCGGGDFNVAPAAGTVTIDGVPFTTGQVMLTPVAKPGETLAGPAAIGSLDGRGRFVLGAYRDADGAVIGDNWVTVINTGEGKGVLEFDRIKVPTGAVTVVADQDNEFAIELTTELLRRYARR